MRGLVFISVFALLCAGGSVAQAADDQVLLKTIYNNTGIIPYQGACAPRTIDRHTATATCYGGSQNMMDLEYQNDARVCVYVDNFVVSRNDFFIPLRSYNEWAHFRDHLAAGGIDGLSLIYGCPATSAATDSCPQVKDLPAGRNGDDIEVASGSSYRATYHCNAPGIADVCGIWEKVSETGQCLCGTAHEHHYHDPPDAGLCQPGAASSPVSLQGVFYKWTCASARGGHADCQAYHAGYQACGPADGGSFPPLDPNTPLCPPDSQISDFAVNGTQWTWNCFSGAGETLAYGACSATVNLPAAP